ncbi:MAG: hypothetical protein MZV64_02590 [Ignavibacteriales bacterium]|nr:hypothetical protein [Ignavibacteriales bacterium]
MRQEEEIRASLQERLEALEAAVESDERMGFEALEKVRELQRLYEEIDSPELRENLARLGRSAEAGRSRNAETGGGTLSDLTGGCPEGARPHDQSDAPHEDADAGRGSDPAHGRHGRRQEKLNDTFGPGIRSRRDAAIREEEKLKRRNPKPWDRMRLRCPIRRPNIPGFPDSGVRRFLSEWEKRDFPGQFGSDDAGAQGRGSVRSRPDGTGNGPLPGRDEGEAGTGPGHA